MGAGHLILDTLADLVFPRTCLICQRTLAPDGAIWCRACAETLLAATSPDYCPRCGLAVGPHLVDAAGCRACRDGRNPLDGLARIGDYATVVGELVKRYKYGRQQRLDQPLATLLVAAMQGQAWAADLEALVPVPTTLRSRLRYGFRPTAQLARCVGRELEIAVLPLVGVRGKRRKQVGLPESQRSANVRGVFHVHARACIAGKALCVVDDVSTTGSTLREIARALKQAGARRVYAAVVAKTDPARAWALGA